MVSDLLGNLFGQQNMSAQQQTSSQYNEMLRQYHAMQNQVIVTCGSAGGGGSGISSGSIKIESPKPEQKPNKKLLLLRRAI